MEQAKRFFQEHKHALLFACLMFYIIVLGFGVAGEVLNITWIKRLLAP